jgi:hypothetical protein
VTICTCGEEITFTGTPWNAGDLMWRHLDGYAGKSTAPYSALHPHFAKPKTWWRRWDKRGWEKSR